VGKSYRKEKGDKPRKIKTQQNERRSNERGNLARMYR
jgi:hypothetical protein